jgi:hydroxymethylglutaryl-CoA lyase
VSAILRRADDGAAPVDVVITDVTLRDGLQYLPYVALSRKLALLEELTAAGVSSIEVCSFVNPHKVPQFSDAEELLSLWTPPPGVRVSALVLNQHGLERAVESGVRAVAVSQSFGTVREAMAGGLLVRAYVSSLVRHSWAPGENPPVVAAVSELLAEGAAFVVIADERDVADERTFCKLLDELDKAGVPMDRLALHLHDGNGLAFRKAVAGIERGIREIDAATAGVGSVPALEGRPGWGGNIATERIVEACGGRGIRTGIAGQGLGRAADQVAVILNEAEMR